MNRSGSRAYTLETDPTCRIRAFDLTTPPANAEQFAEITTTFPLTITCPGSESSAPWQVQTTLSPDGNTLFLAGAVDVIAVPLD